MGELKKMLTESKKLNISIILLIILDIIAILFGILYAVLGFMPYHAAAVGKSSSEISNFDPELMVLISTTIRVNGFMFLGLAAMSLIIIYVGFRNKEKWAWISHLILGALVYIPLVILVYIATGFAMPFPITLFDLILWIIALSISYKEFFGE